MIELVSFDVFETTLVRRTGSPATTFLVLGRRLAPDAAERIARAREEAERCARRRCGPSQDPHLRDIHRQLAWMMGWGDSKCDASLRCELEIESELLAVNPRTASRIASAHRRGFVIAFTSDTYLPAAFVREQLLRHGVWSDGDHLLVSCEQQATKRAGTLFRVLASSTRTPLSAIAHVGNDEHADRRAARGAGVRTVLLDEGNLTPDEITLDDHRWMSGGLSAAFAGASRAARLRETASELSTLRTTAAAITAPTLVGFGLWILREAQRRGIDRLFFLSREGQLPLMITQRLADRLDASIDCSYLYGSRQSLNLAALDPSSRPDLAWCLTHVESNSTRTILQRLRIRPEQVAADLEALGLPADSWDHVPDRDLREVLFEALVDGCLHEPLTERVRDARSIVTTYLEQQGFLAGGALGVVDLSGVGSQFRALHILRERSGQRPAPGMLFTRSRDPYLAAEGGYSDTTQPTITAFMDDDDRGEGFGTPPGLVQLLEVFCAADHGTVLDYRAAADGIVEPVLAPYDHSPRCEWGLPTLRAVVDDFLDELHLRIPDIDLDGDVRAALIAVLRRLWMEPSPAEARAWGSYPFEGTSGHEESVNLAEPLSIADVLSGIRRGRVETRSWFDWPAASTQLSPLHVQGALRTARSIKQRLPVQRRP